MILNILTYGDFMGLETNYCGLLNNLDLPIKVLENTDYYHVHWGGSLMPPLKPVDA